MSEPGRLSFWQAFALFGGSSAMTLGIIVVRSWKAAAWTVLVSVAFGLVAAIWIATGRKP